MIEVGAFGAQAEIPFAIYDNLTPVEGYTFTDAGDGTTAQVQVRVPGGAFANVSLSNIIEWGKGQYAVQLTALQTANPGKVSLHVSVPGYSVTYSPEQIVSHDDSAAAFVQALLSYAHETGATVEGLLVRLEAFITGKATGLNGSVGKFYRRDGSTVAFTGALDVNSGTRQVSDISGSES